MDLSGLEWVLEQICAETCWALPAHVNRKKDEKWKITLDLFACETAQSLLEIAFLLRNDLRPELLCRIWKESSRRVLQPFLIQENGAFWWETSKSNWNAVCCGSVGAAACYASELFPVLFPNAESIESINQNCEQILTRVTRDLSCFLASFGEDGACMEGLGYWEYGMSYFSMFAELLKEKTGGKTDLLDGKKQRKIMEFQQKCYFPGGNTLSFSDGDSKSRYRMGLTCHFAMLDPNVKIPPLVRAMHFGEDPCYRWNAAYRDWIWTKQYLNVLKSRSDGVFVFGSPCFKKVEVKVRGGNTFTVEAPNNSKENIYIQKVYLNGKPYDKSYITYQDIINGSTLKFVMGKKPNKNFGKAPANRPVVLNKING